ncbi:PrsW family intramembrane metalloprotease [Streptomyces sp. A0642]|uniref:PrsW family glutamic-type intramembrane protease n=1 Tax=Streptomyces sp. A0642 TaxID=2563100 RepID=UPI0010A2A252|nr:PrsW family glutamic-type intramembrane protease [Streptomyces sp. A0642]THA74482.1 PrsW family intramembrane metalloprotease [Streptomyces sp. A0642]
MTLVMAVAAVWGVLQLFALSWPARSVRLPTVLLAVAVGVYGCGVATALLQLTYTRLYADWSGQPLAEVVSTSGYTVAPWVEELLKVAPLLLAGLYAKVRRQWGLTDFLVLGAGLGAGFGLLEAVLRYGLDTDRAIPREGGGWVIPDSLFPPYIPGLGQVFTTWLPGPTAQSHMIGPLAAETFSHLVWTASAGLGVGLLWRTRGWVRVLAVVPPAAASAHHAVNNYVAAKPTVQGEQWLATLNEKAWAVPLVCLAIAMAIDLHRLHRAKRTVPGVLLATERTDGDTTAALLRYAAWRPRWTLLIALRYIRLRRSLLYATALSPPGETEPLRRAVARITEQMDATDRRNAWHPEEIRAHLKAARPGSAGRRWLLLVPCVLALPGLLFLGVGSFKATAGLQEYFTTGSGPTVLMGFGVAALAWIAWQLITLLRTWRPTSVQPHGEPLAAHRFRIATALGGATTGLLLLCRGLGEAGPDGKAIPALHLLEALDDFLVYLGFALLLISLLALFPPGGLAFAGIGAVGGATASAAVDAALLGTAGVVLMAAGAQGASSSGAARSSGGKRRSVPQSLRDKWNKGSRFNKDNWHRYPANEIYLENGKYLDSYRPGKEIVSRKYTQISRIKRSTFMKSLGELGAKYRIGTRIPDTAKARREYPHLIGKTLKGKYYLEVPVQAERIPTWALEEAMKRRVIIRDVTGHVYRIPKG